MDQSEEVNVKLAIYQGPPIQGVPEAGLERLKMQLRAASMAGARMLVAPELFLPGYNRPNDHVGLSQPKGGDWHARLSAMAREAGCGLTVGWAERHMGHVYNAATAFDPAGQEIGHYRKIQLFGPMEQASFAYGDAYCIFEFEGIATAILICYDVEFAPHVKSLAEQGVKLLLVPTANPAGFEYVQDAFVPARAAEADMIVLYANFCGEENGIRFGGKSLAVGPDGQVLAQAGQGEALLVFDMNTPIAPELRSMQLKDYRKV